VTTVGNGQSGYFYAEIGFTDKTGQGLALALNGDNNAFLERRREITAKELSQSLTRAGNP
jgi:hypothetical protein